MNIDELLRQIEVPEENKTTPIKDVEAKFIHQFVKDHSFKKTFETGCGYGKSAIAILAATQSPHIVIDPFQSNYHYGGVNNIKKVGFGELLQFKEDYSSNVLPQLVKEKQKFDFIFIDGDHRFDGIFVDFFYADQLLEQNGCFMFHDTWMHTTQLVMSFIKKNRTDYVMMESPLRNISIFKKTGTDLRKSMDHKGFYTRKSWLTHRIIMWLSSGEQTAMKKMFTSAKSFYVKLKPK